MMEPLRPYQTAALLRQSKRLILAHVPGAGKTRTALTIAAWHFESDVTRCLIICPARARPTWIHEATKWTPAFIPAAIRFGAARKGLTKAQQSERDLAYKAAYKVVSYGLLGEPGVIAKYDLIVADESHKLSNPQSAQSKLMSKLMKLNPDTPALFLTGSFIRNEVAGCWNQLHLLWPNKWGRPTQAGDVSFKFRKDYCLSRPSEYSPSGFEYYGADPEKLPALRAKLEPFIHVVSDDDIAPFLPPATVAPLYIDDKATYKDAVKSWAQDAAENFSHVGIICYNIDTSYELAAALQSRDRPVFCVNSKTARTAETRAEILEAARRSEKCFFIGTSESIGESVSLTFARKTLITQWRSTPGQAVQLLKRFVRTETGAKPVFIEYLIFPEDLDKSELLMARANAVTALLGKNTTTDMLDEIMAPRPLTEERLDDMFAKMMSTTRTVAQADGGEDE